MTNMLEQVAMALWNFGIANTPKTSPFVHAPWDSQPECVRQVEINRASAVLHALRNPTEAICENLKWRFDNDMTYGSKEDVEWFIHDYIDAALRDPTDKTQT